MVGFESSSYTKITEAFVLFEFLVCSATRDRNPNPIEKQMKFISSKTGINDELEMQYSLKCCEQN
jgi:hypothetical protein